MDVRLFHSGHNNGQSTLISNQRGFSLIELLTTLTVVAILLTNVIPDLTRIVASEQGTVLTNRLAGALAYARSEAIVKQKIITACQSNNGNDCQRSENWHNGWIIFVDENKNNQRDIEERLLRVEAAADNGTIATFRGSAGIRHYVKYKPDGRVYPNGSFLICNPQVGVGKALVLTLSGRLRLSKNQTNGSAVTCQ